MIQPKMIRSALGRAWRGDLPAIPAISGPADARWSVISSPDDVHTVGADDLLMDRLLAAAARARTMDLSAVAGRCQQQDAAWVRQWPGEHYRLLAALAAEIRPDVVVEIGTFKGQGALALAAGSADAHVVTYDVIGWRDFPDTALRDDDFAGGRIEQRLGDLGDLAYLSTQLDTLRSAGLIFIDGPKDGQWEQSALPLILGSLTDRRRLVVLDDVRLMEMVQLWWDLPYPKLDATSLGHWSGTGLLHTV